MIRNLCNIDLIRKDSRTYSEYFRFIRRQLYPDLEVAVYVVEHAEDRSYLNQM